MTTSLPQHSVGQPTRPASQWHQMLSRFGVLCTCMGQHCVLQSWRSTQLTLGASMSITADPWDRSCPRCTLAEFLTISHQEWRYASKLAQHWNPELPTHCTSLHGKWKRRGGKDKVIPIPLQKQSFLTHCNAFAMSDSASCPHVGHSSNSTLETPKKGLRQGEGGGRREAESLAPTSNVAPLPSSAMRPESFSVGGSQERHIEWYQSIIAEHSERNSVFNHIQSWEC